MGIDMTQEELLAFDQALQYLPEVNGRRHSLSTLNRWCRRGINGVRLEYVRVGRSMATSREAIQRFLAAPARADE